MCCLKDAKELKDAGDGGTSGEEDVKKPKGAAFPKLSLSLSLSSHFGVNMMLSLCS